MASLNKVCIIGYLGHAPSVQYSQDGKAVCHLSVATDESYVSKDGERVARTEWHRVNVFGRQAENCGVYLSKGSMVYVEGSLGTRKWQDKDGSDRYSTEITARTVTFLDRRQSESGQPELSREAPQPQRKKEGIASDYEAAFGPSEAKSVMDDFPF